ncbi:MAG: galactose ABC transporter substrate-binding protein [Bacillales bacterium]|jgi:methyl-galactoside transport system substrate-binding protein|nr:galactose ABC transporter substrate-binding protein [Bacillales bacterium]
MKKSLFAVGLAALLVGLGGCTAKSNYHVDIFIYKYADTYIGSVRNEVEKLLNAEEGIEYRFYDADGSQQTQTSQIDTAIARNSDLLVTNIVDTGAGETVAGKAKTAKTPIIFFNREVSDETINSYDEAAFIGTDPDEAGYMQGQLIFDILKEDYAKYDLNHDGVIQYLMLRADLDNPEANGRTTYSVQEANRLLATIGKPALANISSDQMAGWDLGIARTMTETVLSQHPFTVSGNPGPSPIEFIIANNDDMALGAVEALNGYGPENGHYNTGVDGSPSIPVVGVDATATAQEAITAHKMSGTVKQDGVAMAKAIVAFIKSAKAGNSKDYTKDTEYEYRSGRKVRIPYAIFK